MTKIENQKRETLTLKSFAHDLMNVVYELEKNNIEVGGKKLTINQQIFDSLFVVEGQVPKKKVRPQNTGKNVGFEPIKRKSVETLENK